MAIDDRLSSHLQINGRTKDEERRRGDVTDASEKLVDDHSEHTVGHAILTNRRSTLTKTLIDNR